MWSTIKRLFFGFGAFLLGFGASEMLPTHAQDGEMKQGIIWQTDGENFFASTMLEEGTYWLFSPTEIPGAPGKALQVPRHPDKRPFSPEDMGNGQLALGPLFLPCNPATTLCTDPIDPDDISSFMGPGFPWIPELEPGICEDCEECQEEICSGDPKVITLFCSNICGHCTEELCG